MNAFTRKLAFSAALACLSLALGVSPALAAKVHHHKHHVKTHHHGKAVKATKVSNSKTIVRIAQDHLAHLGYYVGKIDGVMGPQTKAAIKSFQREHALTADGVLGPKTKLALENADHVVIGTHAEILTHENVVGSDVNNVVDQDFDTSLNGGTRVIVSRFARLDVNESGEGANKHYAVNLNGGPLLTVDGQPSIIGISTTFDLGNEDAVVFTTYSPNNPACTYQNHVLALSNAGSKMLDIENCTRDYQAQVNNGSLYIRFPERDDNRTIGATWRLEGTDLERL
jgi:hypothetical protein